MKLSYSLLYPDWLIHNRGSVLLNEEMNEFLGYKGEV